jgi:hypothetical protein
MVSMNGQPSLRSETQDFGLEAEVTEQVTQTSAPSVVCFPLLYYSAVLPLTTLNCDAGLMLEGEK